MKPKDNKELRELEEAIEQANREYTDTFSPIEETKRMYRIYTIEYDKDGNDKGAFTHQDDLLKLEIALAQARQEGREEVIRSIRWDNGFEICKYNNICCEYLPICRHKDIDKYINFILDYLKEKNDPKDCNERTD
jgi:hypothetical protein